MPHTPELPQGVRPGDVLIVVHDFEARGADELTLRRGDKVELLELDEGFGDGWYLGKHIIENRTGLFPGVYTTTAPKISVRQPASQASNSSTTSKPRRNSEPSGSPKVVENSADPVSPGSNDDITPQASRQVSGTDFKPPTSESNESTTRHQQGPNTAPPPASTVPLSPTVQRTISEAMSSRRNGEDSPVMNETLSVIDEHITNFNTPRHSFVAQEPRNPNDSGSEYSSHIDHRMSYIPGAETDEEEEAGYSESTIRSWDPRQTSQHLRELGVDPKHCDIFEEQEITGDVLLEMDQEFIYMKEFNFGVMGRRLKTWHIIKTFQEEVKGIKRPRQSSSTFSGRDSSADEFDRSQSRAGGSFLPRIPSLTEGQGKNQRRSRGTSSPKPPSGVTASISSTLSSNASPVSPLSQSMGLDSSSRPSAASVRQINHARPHSSMDSSPMSPPPNIRTSKANHGASGDKKSSFDRGWTMAGGSQGLNNRPDGASGDPIRQQTFPGLDAADSESSLAVDSADLDRGYFSGGELDMRKSRNVLKKQHNSSGRSYSHSRNSSAADDLKQLRNKRHSRFGSADSIRDLVPHISTSSKIYQSGSLKGRPGDHRTKESFGDQSHAPTVTNLEGNNSPSHGIFSAFSPLYSKTNEEGSGRSSPLPSAHLKNVAPKVRRAIGLRAISDAVTGNEKALVSSPTSITSNKDSPKSPTRTNSSTPSGASKSFEMESTDGSGKPIEGAFALVTLPKATAARSKSKKDTSAYVRGLEKKTPQEQMIGCDYCGWMKKKSSNLMTTWKPRLFVLRGRRLSYYYSENDTEERGLIDISSHRVFRADQDTITSLHATITGAKASPTSPMNFNPPSPDTDIVSDISPRPKSTSSDAPFIFKLVPPKAGLSRAVQFTKPSIHFFQVDNIQQGRLWMAALMKATIERDLNLPVRTTNKQKTISLKQARATNQRPPALMAAEARNNPEKNPDSESNGHAVQGLNIETPETNGDGKNASNELEKLEVSDTGSSTLVS